MRHAHSGGEMKYTVVIDPDREEEILIYAREKSPLIEKIEKLLDDRNADLVAYCGEEIVSFKADSAECFFVEKSRLFAIFRGKKYVLKQRLYQVEETVGEDFVKINQSCLVNVKAIEKFEMSVGGSLRVKLKCGYTDYVSRRQLKTVKEKIGI